MSSNKSGQPACNVELHSKGVDPKPSPLGRSRDPLHGITLENIVNQLVARYGWEEMGDRIPIRCFQYNPSVKSSLTFLRKTPWARLKVEKWFIESLKSGEG